MGGKNEQNINRKKKVFILAEGKNRCYGWVG